MSRRSYPWPPVHPAIDAIADAIPFIRKRLTRLGVPAQDVDDVLQEILAAAITSIREGRYCPDPRVEPREMLRRWLSGIVFHQAEHHRKRAYRTREVLCGTPDQAAPETRAEAWDILRALAALRPELREAIKLEALGWKIREIAVHLAIPTSTAALRLRVARQRIRRSGGR